MIRARYRLKDAAGHDAAAEGVMSHEPQWACNCVLSAIESQAQRDAAKRIVASFNERPGAAASSTHVLAFTKKLREGMERQQHGWLKLRRTFNKCCRIIVCGSTVNAARGSDISHRAPPGARPIEIER